MSFKETVKELAHQGKRNYSDVSRDEESNLLSEFINEMSIHLKYEALVEGDKENRLPSLMGCLFINKSISQSFGDELKIILKNYFEKEIEEKYNEIAAEFISEKFPKSIFRDSQTGESWYW